MWHIIWNGFLIITPTDNKIRGPSCCDYAFHKFGFAKKKRRRRRRRRETFRYKEVLNALMWILASQMIAVLSGSVGPVRAAHTALEWNFACNLTRLCCKEKASSLRSSFCSVFSEQKKKLELSPPSLMTPDKYPVFLRCVSCSPQHRAETSLAQDAVCLVNREPYCRSNTICLVFYEMNQRLGDQ